MDGEARGPSPGSRGESHAEEYLMLNKQDNYSALLSTS